MRQIQSVIEKGIGPGVTRATQRLWRTSEGQDSNRILFILVSQGCHNKLPHTRWLKTNEIFSLTVLEARCPKSRCWQGHLASEVSREKPSLPRPGSGSLWLHISTLPPSSHGLPPMCVGVSNLPHLSLLRIPAPGLRDHHKFRMVSSWDAYLTSAKTFSSNKVTFTVSEVKIWMYLLGATIQPTTLLLKKTRRRN